VKTYGFYISRLIWFDAQNQKGYTVDYKKMILHGVSRDTTEFPRMHIYCQLSEIKPVDAEIVVVNPSEEEKEDDRASVTDMNNVEEIRLAPKDCTHCKSFCSVIYGTTRRLDLVVDDIFKAMSECAALHVDSSDSDSGGNGENI
jgi:hypothetical protein